MLAGMTTIVSAHGPHDFLAIVPHLTGFIPERSLVLVAMRGNRSCGALRFDLPPDGSRALLKRVATSLIGMLCKIPAVDALVPVVYTPEPIELGIAPHTELITVLRERAGYSGFLVRDALCVAANGWGSYLEEQLPASGHPLAMIAASPAAGALPNDPRALPITVADGARLPVATEKERREVSRARARQRKALLDVNALTPPRWDDDATARFVAMVEEQLGPDAKRCAPREAAVVIGALQSDMARDAALLQWSFGPAMGQRVVEEDLEFLQNPELVGGDEETTRLLLGVGPRPDPVRIERAIEVLKRLASLAPRADLPGLLTMLAWLSWALGRGSIAGAFTDRARSLDPECGFAALLDAILSGGHLPEWAFQVPPTPFLTSRP